MKNIFFIMLLTQLVGCLGASNIKIKKNLDQTYTPEGNVLLLSASLTSKPDSKIEISCEKGTSHYLISASSPTKNDLGWMPCLGAKFEISKSIVDGNNNLKFWFKTSTGLISSSSKDLYIKKGNSFLITSPDIGANQNYSYQAVLILSPSKFLVTDSFNSRNGLNAGAVHIYDINGNFIRSIYGENPGDEFGGDFEACVSSCMGEVVKLGTDKFAIISPSAQSLNGLNANVGVVYVYNFEGVELYRVEGTNANDYLGGSGITNLPNGNFIIKTGDQTVNGNLGAGSIKLVNGLTGIVLATFEGDQENDGLDREGVTVLKNGNFTINSSGDDTLSVENVGSIKLVNSFTGELIANIEGDFSGDQLGSAGVTALLNGNFTISSPNDDTSDQHQNEGSVKLVNGITGVVIASIEGDYDDDFLGEGGVKALSNGNFVISSPNDRIGLNMFAGSVKLINGTTGSIIGSIEGENEDNFLGSEGQVTVLPNGNFILSSSNDTVGTNANAGSVSLINGLTGATLFKIEGDDENDKFGSNGVTLLENGNFIINSQYDKIGANSNAGSVKLVNGVSGAILASIEGDDSNDNLGEKGSVILNNGNFVIISPSDIVNGNARAGSVKLVNEITGVVLSSIEGDNENDSIGEVGVTILPNKNFIISSSGDSIGLIDYAGSVKLINGMNGVVLSSIEGDTSYESLGSHGSIALPNNNFIARAPFKTISGNVNAGAIILVPSN